MPSGKQPFLQATAANGKIQKATQGKQDRQFTDGYGHGIDEETAADVHRQFPAHQNGIEQGGHDQRQSGKAPDLKIPGQIHASGYGAFVYRLCGPWSVQQCLCGDD